MTDGRRGRPRLLGPGRGDERGQVGGIEALAFGGLVCVFGTLLVVNAWAVVDAKSATAAAAREAARTFVEAVPAEDADLQARAAGLAALEGFGRRPTDAVVRRVEGTGRRCARVVYEAASAVPLVQVPVIGSFGRGFRVSSRHSEVVDPYRSGVGGGAATCA